MTIGEEDLTRWFYKLFKKLDIFELIAMHRFEWVCHLIRVVDNRANKIILAKPFDSQKDGNQI